VKWRKSSSNHCAGCGAAATTAAAAAATAAATAAVAARVDLTAQHTHEADQ